MCPCPWKLCLGRCVPWMMSLLDCLFPYDPTLPGGGGGGGWRYVGLSKQSKAKFLRVAGQLSTAFMRLGGSGSRHIGQGHFFQGTHLPVDASAREKRSGTHRHCIFLYNCRRTLKNLNLFHKVVKYFTKNSSAFEHIQSEIQNKVRQHKQRNYFWPSTSIKFSRWALSSQYCLWICIADSEKCL